jgi:ERCC4-type nuclease
VDVPIFISSTEPEDFRKHFPGHKSSTLPERYGCDVAWPVGGVWWGVQRKELRDFVASVQDGRLGKELGQMRSLPFPVVVLEGEARFQGGFLDLGYRKPLTKKQWLGMQFGVMGQGVQIIKTRDKRETAEIVKLLLEWSLKGKHGSVMTRPGPTHAWGKADNRAYQEHFLMGIPGVGLDLAKRILDRFGGIPMSWKVSEDALMEIDGIGAVKAKAIYDTLPRG